MALRLHNVHKSGSTKSEPSKHQTTAVMHSRPLFRAVGSTVNPEGEGESWKSLRTSARCGDDPSEV